MATRRTFPERDGFPLILPDARFYDFRRAFKGLSDLATALTLELSGSGPNYITIASASTPIIGSNAGGIMLQPNTKRALYVNSSGGADVNYITVSSNTTLNGPIITAAGDDANVALHLRSKGTGQIIIATAASYPVATFGGAASRYFKFDNNATNPTIDTTAGGVLILSAGKSNTLFTNSGGSDVNYINISSNTTTNGPIITAAGETNVTLHLRSKGTGNVVIGSDGYPIAQFTAGTAANYLTFANAANDPVLSTASAGAIKIPTLLQITNYTVPTAGAGLELGYDASGVHAFVQAYDRTGAAWKNLGLSGYNVGINAHGGVVQLTGTGAFAAGDKYLIVDASGNVHVSALGPAS